MSIFFGPDISTLSHHVTSQISPIDSAGYSIRFFVDPSGVITSEDLARVVVHVGLYGTEKENDSILENRMIRTLAKPISEEKE